MRGSIKTLAKKLVPRKMRRWCKHLLDNDCMADKVDALRDAARSYYVNTNLSIIAQSVHAETFRGYRDKHAGRDVVLVATGPTMAYYKPAPGSGLVHCGLNRAIEAEGIELDYLFFQDWGAFRDVEMQRKLFDYRNPDMVKFVGKVPLDVASHYVVPESFSRKINAKRYIVRTPHNVPDGEMLLATEIECEPLGDFCSVAFPALQFLLYTNPRRIYLVGCDASGRGHAVKQESNTDFEDLLPGWRQLAHFAKTVYPNVEIISVNPVGLRGMFRDVYTADNPDRPADGEIWG